MGIRIRWRICTILLAVLVLKCPVLWGAGKEQRIFVLEVTEGGRLCGYTNEDEWTRAPKPQDPEFVAIAESVSGVLTAVLVERDTEDTATYDEYTVDKGGNIRRLKRNLDDVSVKITRGQIWDIHDGLATKASESWMEFKTHKPAGPERRQLVDYHVQHTIIVQLKDFPFYSLITDKHPEQWLGGKRCVPGSMSKLEAPQPK